VWRPPLPWPSEASEEMWESGYGAGHWCPCPCVLFQTRLTNGAPGLCMFMRASVALQAPLMARLISSHLTPGFSPIHLHFGCAICFLNKTLKCLLLHTLCPLGASQTKRSALFALRWMMNSSVSGGFCQVWDIVFVWEDLSSVHVGNM